MKTTRTIESRTTPAGFYALAYTLSVGPHASAEEAVAHLRAHMVTRGFIRPSQPLKGVEVVEIVRK